MFYYKPCKTLDYISLLNDIRFKIDNKAFENADLVVKNKPTNKHTIYELGNVFRHYNLLHISGA